GRARRSRSRRRRACDRDAATGRPAARASLRHRRPSARYVSTGPRRLAVTEGDRKSSQDAWSRMRRRVRSSAHLLPVSTVVLVDDARDVEAARTTLASLCEQIYPHWRARVVGASAEQVLEGADPRIPGLADTPDTPSATSEW